MPTKFNVAHSLIVQCLGRNRPSTCNFHFRQFCFTKSTLIKKSKSSINFVRYFLAKQWNVFKIINIRVAEYTYTRSGQIAISLIFFQLFCLLSTFKCYILILIFFLPLWLRAAFRFLNAWNRLERVDRFPDYKNLSDMWFSTFPLRQKPG